MNVNEISNEYFNWLMHVVCESRYSDQISYRKLLMHLHNTEFIWKLRGDENRAEDGIDLRLRFSDDSGFERDYLSSYLNEPCSVLEMLLALAIRCEETIMDDPNKGNRTGQWFWGMIVNLGLGSMMDNNYDKNYVTNVITTFLNRKYESNGRGGLFTVRNCKRRIEIWHQLCLYLDSIT